jgi:hypothetical protein
MTLADRPLAMGRGPAYVMAMADPPDAPNKTLRIAGAIVLFGALFAILIAAGWYAVGAWNAVGGAPIPRAGYIAMILGIVFSLIVGCGLMALLFYSHRHGYDDQVRYVNPHQYDDLQEGKGDGQQ